MTPSTPPATDPDALVLDVVSDVVCPWCYVGKRHLEAAIATLVEAGDPVPVVRWHPYELNPDMPSAGVPRRDYLERKFGGPARAGQIYDRVRSAGTQAGIAFDFERIQLQPNTRDAHRLIAWGQSHGDANALVEALFRAYFIEGRFIGSQEVLVEIARASGFDADAAADFLFSGHGTGEIAAAEARAADLGVTGVPFFIVEGRYGLSGAQPAEAIVRAIRRARQREAAD